MAQGCSAACCICVLSQAAGFDTQMPIRLLFDQSKAVIGKTTKVVLTESDQRELVRAQFSGDARLVKLVPVGGTGRNGGMRMRWTSGETCEFVFTREVLEYELTVCMAKTKKQLAFFSLSFTPAVKVVQIDKFLIEQNWDNPLSRAKREVALAKAIKRAVNEASGFWDIQTVRLISEKPVPSTVTDGSLRALRRSQALSLMGCTDDESKRRLPNEVMGIVFGHLCATRPVLCGELPMSYVQSDSAFGFSGLLREVGKRAGVKNIK